jgi:hypothetical protein
MRYLPLTEPDRREMLAAIGAPSVESLFRDVPEAARYDGGFDLPDHKSELEVEQIIGALAKRNMAAGDVPSFLGAGAYRHHIPASVDHLIQRGEYLTSYTPYQPEISQGTLQALFEFQTQVALITGMEVANASMYDGATSCAEAVLMARRITRRDKAILSGGLHPHYRDVTETQTRYLDLEIVSSAPDLTGAEDLSALIDDETACVVVQNPGFFGHLRDLSALADQCQAKGALLIAVVPEVISLGAVMAPGDMGADIEPGQPVGLRRALCGAVRGAGEICPPDARPALRSNRRRRRAPRLGTDPVDPRAAYSPGEGDQQYLHEFRPLRAGLHHPFGAARRGRVPQSGGAQPCPRRPACRTISEGQRRRNRHRCVFQRVRRAPAARRRRCGR